jgi:methylated-DNA-[protein]-cysteine S-methyltransferase
VSPSPAAPRTLHRSFGALELSLQFLPCGSLCSVQLPASPPDALEAADLLEAFNALARFPITPPRSQAEARFREALERLSPGQTVSYGTLAGELQTAPRALGSLCRSNRLLLRFPCHRVLAAQGPGGYRAGIAWKLRLLALEKAL